MKNDRLREGPVSWPQSLHLLPRIRRFQEASGRTWLNRVIEVPFATDVSKIENALRAVVRRHEVLRSTFEVDRHGRYRQIVWAPASRPLTLLRLHGKASIITVAGLGDEVPYDPTQDWPVRYALDIGEDGRYRIITKAAHPAADYYGLKVLRDEILYVLRNPAAATIGGRAVPQPIDIAEFERSARGKAINDQAIKYWLSHLDAYDGCHRWLHRRYSSAGNLELTARVAFANLGQDIVRRAGNNSISVSALSVSVVSKALSILMGWEIPFVDLVVENRHFPGSRKAVCTLAQRVILPMPNSTRRDVVSHARECFPLMLKAAKNAHYDPLALKSAICARGGDADSIHRRVFTINVIRSDRNNAYPQISPESGVIFEVLPLSNVDSMFTGTMVSFYLYPDSVNIFVQTSSGLFTKDSAREFLYLIQAIIKE